MNHPIRVFPLLSRVAPIAGVAALLVTGVDCSGSTSASSSTEGAITSFCSTLQSCFPIGFPSTYSSIADCTTQVTASLDAQIAQPGQSMTVSDQVACVNAIVAAGCGGVVGLVDLDSICNKPGTGAAGSACQVDAQCASTSCASVSTTNAPPSACGQCAAPLSNVAAGGECHASPECAGGLGCIEGACATVVAIGAACDNSHFCAYGATCDATTAKCKALGGVGAACTSSSDCDADKGAICDPAGSNKCVAITQTIVAVGQACGASSAPSTTRTSCGPEVSCIANVCVANATSGGACDATNGPFCGAGLQCTSGKCAAPAICGGTH